jgi:hypothetical protein
VTRDDSVTSSSSIVRVTLAPSIKRPFTGPRDDAMVVRNSSSVLVPTSA